MLPIWSRSIPRPTSVETLTKHRSTLGRQSINMSVACRSRVDRVTIDISPDASVDVSVEVRYKIHDPTSSTFREILAVKFVLLSLVNQLSGLTVNWFTDNQNVPRIISSGSSKELLQSEALSIFKVVL